MKSSPSRAIAVVGVGAMLPDAPDAPTFWRNIRHGRYSISEVPEDRWSTEKYWDPDPKVPAKTYSKIGGWVRDFEWEPLKWRLPIPPKVGDAMDRTQKLAVAASRQALADYGYPDRPLDSERTAVILGNAMAGDRHYLTSLRINFPEYAEGLAATPGFAALPEPDRVAILEQLYQEIASRLPEITEDTMPGELANIIAGRVANLYDFRGPNFVCDAACASAIAAISAAIEGLEEDDYDAVLTGGVDANMSAATFTKFCKIGALSATGTRPYADGADGFVMGEGAAVFVLKRLADAERDGDSIYAVIRGVGGSSDGRGKGITAPNPVGQRLAVERAWQRAGVRPTGATLIEGHGTSTKVGDVVEVASLGAAFRGYGFAPGSLPLGSVKSNIGHLKGAAGAAGLLKAMFALRDKELPPSLGFERPNPNIDFTDSPFFVNTELRPWDTSADEPRRAGISAFGFGGTNFHAVLEEYVPGRLSAKSATVAAAGRLTGPRACVASTQPPAPPRGALLIGAGSQAALLERLTEVEGAASRGSSPDPAIPARSDLGAAHRIAIDYDNAEELAQKAKRALTAYQTGRRSPWTGLASQGVYRGCGEPGKVAFLFSGQGSQYVNMLRDLVVCEPVVAEVYAEADAVTEPLLGRPLTEFIFADPSDEKAMAQAQEDLRQTAITQPAVLAVDIALCRLLASHGIAPDMVIGHSLGEYGALVAAGSLSFADALLAVSARGMEMSRVSVEDSGKMAAVFAPLAEVEETLAAIDGYVVVANVNSRRQAVIGGASDAVDRAIEIFQTANRQVASLPVSHAFHTEIVAAAGEPLTELLAGLDMRPPRLPLISNVTGGFYPSHEGCESEMVDLLGRQIASPVQFVQGLETLYEAGVRVFVELGPKRALHGFVSDVLGDREGVVSLYSNHPKVGGVKSFSYALCGCRAAGLGTSREDAAVRATTPDTPAITPSSSPTEPVPATPPAPAAPESTHAPPAAASGSGTDVPYEELGRLFADFLDKGFQLYSGRRPAAPQKPMVVTGAALGLPGTARVFDDSNVGRILRGEQLISEISPEIRAEMVDRNITRLVKNEHGDGRFETIDDVRDVIKLAARAGRLDLEEEFGFPADRLAALDTTSQLAIGAGIDALRDAGIPLVLRYKTTSKGTQLPDRWGLADSLRDDTGIIFASAFPGIDFLAGESRRYHTDRARRERLAELEALRARAADNGGLAEELDSRIAAARAEIERDGYTFDRRFLFRLLSMGHSQFAELIGARGPNTQINSACASTTQAVGLAEDWIRRGRCRRVVVVSGDNVTSDELMGWIGAGFLASGAAATDERVEDAAIPFDRRRHGMLIGMGAAAIVVEEADLAAERGIQPICEVLSTQSANSAFHGTRLNVDHICGEMESLVSRAEAQWGIRREEIAGEMVFVSHETYTPARGGSAQAEVYALRQVFGETADRIVVANTKGFTGHPMGVGIEDVVAIKILETGRVPPVANFREVDPELGRLNLSRGGSYPVRYALRLGAGFGSQISLSLMRWVPSVDGRRPEPEALGYNSRLSDAAAWQGWLDRIGGHSGAELEVDRRTLKVRDRGALAKASTAHRNTSTEPAPEPLPAIQSPASEPPTSAAPDPIAVKVLEIVAEKTGYPPEMLDLELDLEADLGIDTVKQAETFAAIRGEWSIERDEELALRDYPTLAHAIQFVYDKRPDLERPAAQPAVVAPPHPAAAPPAVSATPETAVDPIQVKVLEIVADQTGYPPEMLDLDLDLEADLGIDTVKQAETFAAIRGEWDIERDEELALRDYPTLAHAIQFVYDKRPDLARPATETPPDPGPAASAADDEVREKVLAIVAEKTGYPPEMLDLDLDLEADLGIDTVKQAETFAAIREEWGIERDDELALREYPTLAHAIQFVYDRRPDLRSAAGPGSAVAADTEAAAPVATPDSTTDSTAEVTRRVPVPVLRPPLDLCVETGVVLEKGTRVLVRRDRGGVGDALVTRLEKLGVEVLSLEAEDPDGVTAQIEEWLEAGPVSGAFWLPALDRAPAPSEMSAAQWDDALRARVGLLFATARALYETLEPNGAFLVAATRLGGRHGYDEKGAIAPLGGAVTGFVKTLKRERPAALVKAVDFPESSKTAALADRLIDEALGDPGAVEIGYSDGHRWTVAMAERDAGATDPDLTLGPDSVFVVTGAAGSIVSAIVADLATASGGIFHLLDLAPAPDPDDPDLRRFAEDREGLKLELFERLRAAGERATPARIESRLAALERELAALAAIRAVEGAGGTAFYSEVDLLDGEAVEAVIARVRRDHGRIDVLLHAAGLEISRMLPDKEPAEFALVFDVKAKGWFHLMRALGDTPLGAAVAFSSIAGRFGNAGQSDYSSANDLLCKLFSSFRNRRPGTRGVVLDWTAWGEIGMATRGSVPKMMELAGIDMLSPAVGIPIVRRELTAAEGGGEVVVAGRLGVLTREWHPTGGFDPEALSDRESLLAGKVRGLGLHRGLVVETLLDPCSQPFLDDHRIDGTPVLPGVMGIEAFAEAARLPFPDLEVAAVEEVRFHTPFKFYRDEPRTVTVESRFDLDGDEVVAHCRLLGRRRLPGREEPQVTEHFTARVRLAPQGPAESEHTWPGVVADNPVRHEEIYRIYFHGPAYQVLERAWSSKGAAVGLMPSELPDNHSPAEHTTVTAPRLTELCFQTAGLWELSGSGFLGLPTSIERLSWPRTPEGSRGRLCALVQRGHDDGTFDARVVDEAGSVHLALEGYRTVELPMNLDEQELERLREAMR